MRCRVQNGDYFATDTATVIGKLRPKGRAPEGHEGDRPNTDLI